jgi:hypothetical protein
VGIVKPGGNVASAACTGGEIRAEMPTPKPRVTKQKRLDKVLTCKVLSLLLKNGAADNLATHRKRITVFPKK